MEALVVATKENGVELNADKYKYMVMSRDQNAGQNHNVKTDNKFFERVREFIYLKRHSRIQIQFRKELRAYGIQGMLAIFRRRMVFLPVCYLRI
jgi:hypothetical protein